MSRSDETTPSFDRAWDEVARASDPKPSAATHEDTGNDPVGDSRLDVERDEAIRLAVGLDLANAAIPVIPALDPAVLASITVTGAQVSTDMAVAPLPTAIPGSVPSEDMTRTPSETVISTTDVSRPSAAAAMVSVPSMQDQPDLVEPPADGSSLTPVVSESDAAPIPQPHAPAVSVSGDASRVPRPSGNAVATDHGDGSTDSPPLIDDGFSTHDGPTGSGERQSEGAGHGAGREERNGVRPSDGTVVGPAPDGVPVEWSEMGAPSVVGGAGRVVAIEDAASRLPADAVMRTVARGMVEQVHALRTDGAHAWSVQLEPDEFGSVRVQVFVQDQRVTADILAGHPAVRDLFQQHQGELRQALADAGLRVDRLSVGVGDPGQQSPSRSWDSGRESWTGREPAAGWTERRTEPTAATTGWTAWADAGARHAVNVYV